MSRRRKMPKWKSKRIRCHGCGARFENTTSVRMHQQTCGRPRWSPRESEPTMEQSSESAG